MRASPHWWLARQFGLRVAPRHRRRRDYLTHWAAELELDDLLERALADAKDTWPEN